MSDLEAELERINTDLRLTKEARKADHILFNMDRPRSTNGENQLKSVSGKTDKLTAEEKKDIETVRQQYKDVEKFYSKEIDRLNERIREMAQVAQSQKTEMTKAIKEVFPYIFLNNFVLSCGRQLGCWKLIKGTWHKIRILNRLPKKLSKPIINVFSRLYT